MLKAAGVLAFLGAVNGAELSLHSSDGAGRINFVEGETKASIYARCSNDDQSSLSWVHPQFIPHDSHSQQVVAVLHGTPTCDSTSIKTPCYSSDPNYPAYFFCEFKGSEGSLLTAPTSALRNPLATGSQTSINCSVPEDIRSIVVPKQPDEFTAPEAFVDLITWFYPHSAFQGLPQLEDVTSNGQKLEFIGVPDGNLVRIGFAPPAPPSPPFPPPASPPLEISESAAMVQNGVVEGPFKGQLRMMLVGGGGGGGSGHATGVSSGKVAFHDTSLNGENINSISITIGSGGSGGAHGTCGAGTPGSKTYVQVHHKSGVSTFEAAGGGEGICNSKPGPGGSGGGGAGNAGAGGAGGSDGSNGVNGATYNGGDGQGAFQIEANLGEHNTFGFKAGAGGQASGGSHAGGGGGGGVMSDQLQNPPARTSALSGHSGQGFGGGGPGGGYSNGNYYEGKNGAYGLAHIYWTK